MTIQAAALLLLCALARVSFAQTNPLGKKADLPLSEKPKVVVCVGIGQYGPDFGPLPGAEADANDFCRALDTLDYIPFPVPGKRATNGEILGNLQKASDQVRNGGTLVFFFSGPVARGNGEEDDVGRELRGGQEGVRAAGRQVRYHQPSKPLCREKC